MTPYHLGALVVAAAMVLVCGTHPINCTAETMREIVRLAEIIAVGVLGNAGVKVSKIGAGGKPAKKKDPPGEPR